MAGIANVTGHGDGTATVSERLTGVQVVAILFCFILNMIDGADVLIVSFAAPRLMQEWAMSSQTLGLVFSAGLVGMTAGALGLGPLSDRFGRRTMILIAMAVIAAGTIASSFAGGIAHLVALRLFIGLGIGSMLASMTSLAAEFAPPRFRALAVTFATAGYPLGAVLAGLLAGWILPAWGWRGLFLATGLCAAGALPLALLYLPESLAFLMERQPQNAIHRVNALRRRMALEALVMLPPAPARPGIGVGRLLVPEYRRTTLMIWTAFFCTFVTLYFLTSWIPKIVVDAGLPERSAIHAGTAFNLGAFVGVVLLGVLASRQSLTGSIAAFFIGAPVSMLAFGYMHDGLAVILVEIFAVGLFLQGGFGGLYAVAARAYPTVIRTTGVGWGLGAGRLGAVVGPYLGGLALGAGISLQANFVLFALPVAIAGLLVRRLGEPEAA